MSTFSKRGKKKKEICLFKKILSTNCHNLKLNFGWIFHFILILFCSISAKYLREFLSSENRLLLKQGEKGFNLLLLLTLLLPMVDFLVDQTWKLTIRLKATPLLPLRLLQ